MSRQVITIGPSGQVSGLQRKPSQGIDLRSLGKAEIVRVSEVLFSPQEQKWYVKVLEGALAGRVVDEALLQEACLAAPETAAVAENGYILFEDYDDAVKMEIQVLDTFRLRGVM